MSSRHESAGRRGGHRGCRAASNYFERFEAALKKHAGGMANLLIITATIVAVSHDAVLARRVSKRAHFTSIPLAPVTS